MPWTPRVALFADTFYEVNGAARTCREWDAYARRHGLPLFVARCGKAGPGAAEPADGIAIRRGRLAFAVDPDLRFDPLFFRLLDRVLEPLRAFAPDAIHLTSPGDLGILGAIAAAKLRVPLALSWHTNLHEFAARRAVGAMGWLPRRGAERIAGRVERFVLNRVVWFFGRGNLIFAPNADLIEMLAGRTGKPVFPMARGVDIELFHPARRARAGDGAVVVGYAGRLMAEKNVRFLARLAEELSRRGMRAAKLKIVGGGSEREWLEKAIPGADFTGVLTGEALARAYADMDVFVFPSRTDTFGNVVQEALASGVPAVVTDAGGPRFIVDHGVTGWVARGDDELCHYAARLAGDAELRRRMGEAARRQMRARSWDGVFDAVYEGYRRVLPASIRELPEPCRQNPPVPGAAPNVPSR